MSTQWDAVWRRILANPESSWVAFAHGTCVVFVEPEGGADLAAEATKLLQEWGPVHAGSSAGDFSVIDLKDDPGFVVTGHHPDVLVYVGADAFEGEPSEVAVGLTGRALRAEDASALKVVHVEDRR